MSGGGILLLAALLLSGPRGSPPSELTIRSPRGERRVPVRLDRGYPALAAQALASVLSVEAPAARDGASTLRVAGEPFYFVHEISYFRFGGHIYALAVAPYVVRDSLFVPYQWVVESLPLLMEGRFRYDPARLRLEELPASAPVSAVAGRRHTTRVVALDAGHGGLDVGMVGPIGGRPFLREKDVTLAIARAVADELERRNIGAVLTRTTDTLIALRDRGRIASARGADLFVSIHVNAASPRWRDAQDARGFETYFLAEARTEDARRVAAMENESVRFETSADAPSGDPLAFILNDLAQNEHLRESSRLAELIQGQLERVHPAEGRGVKQAGFMVLSTSFMPAALIETGFGSNAEEARFLTSAGGQRRLARAVAEAIDRYLGEYERRLLRGAEVPR